MRLSRYRVVFLVLIVIPALLIPSINPVVATTYTPGVKPGDAWTFGHLLCEGIQCNPFFSNISSVGFVVTSVFGPNVTFTEVVRYLNGTSTTGNFTTNVQNGSGSSFLLLAGGLSAGDRIFNATHAPILNSTITSIFAGDVRTVNVFESSSSGLAFVVWDKLTGILLEVREIFSGIVLEAKVTSTNIWPASTTPYFDTSAQVFPLRVTAGGTNSTLVTLRSINNFAGTVNEAGTVNAGLLVTISPSSVLLSAGSTGTSTITVAAPTSIPRQLYFLTLTGFGGTLTDSIVILVNVTGPGPRFGVTVSPSQLAFTVGSLQNATVTLNSFNGFVGTVTLSAFASPTGPSATFAPSTVSLAPNGTATSTLTMSSGFTGSFNVSVLGGHGSEVERAVVQITVNPSASLNLTHLTLQPNVSNSTTLTISTDPVATFVPTALSSPQTTLLSFGVSTISSSSSGSGFTISATPKSATLVQGTALKSNITVTPIGPYHGPIDLSATVTDPAGVYVVTVTATNGTLTQSVNITVTVQDFVMTPSAPTVVPCIVGGTCNLSIGAIPINGFSQQLSLTTASSPGLSASLSTNSVGVPGSAMLSVGGATVGNYSVTVTGTSGSLSHMTQTIIVQVGDFQLSASPNIVNTNPGTTVSSTIKVSSVNNFKGSVALSISISPSSGLSCSLTGAGLGGGTTILGGSGTAILSCQGGGGSYMVTVSSTSGSIGHSTIVTVNVQDFTISASPALLRVPAGGSGSTLITVGTVAGFSGNVTLAATTPFGLSAIVNPTSVMISGSSSLTVSDVTASAGTYIVPVAGVSGSLSHSTNVTIIVSELLAQPPSFSQMLWVHRLSLSRSGGIQTWRFGVLNPNSNVTLYARVHITASDGSGVNGFTLDSGIVKIGPSKNLTNLSESITLPASDVGDTFTWSAVIEWGTTSSLGSISTASQGVRVSSTFKVVQ